MRLVKVRRTARALIVNPQFEVLLLRVSLPWLDGPTWTMPGGGIEDGESAAECTRREIQEETGYHYVGELIPAWQSRIEYQYLGEGFTVNEQYFVARVPEKFEPSMDDMMDYEKDFSLELKWVGLSELSNGSDYYSPRHIPNMVQLVREGKLPGTPVQLSQPLPDNYRPA